MCKDQWLFQLQRKWTSEQYGNDGKFHVNKYSSVYFNNAAIAINRRKPLFRNYVAWSGNATKSNYKIGICKTLEIYSSVIIILIVRKYTIILNRPINGTV